MSETTFTDPKVIELSKSFVNIIAHRETGHGDSEVLVGKEKIKLCNEYFDIPCSVHTKGWSVVGKFFQGSFGAPSTVFADPSGKEISKVTGGISGGELMKKMNEALTKVSGDKIPQPLWSQALQTRKEGDDALETDDFRKAFDLYSKIGKMKGDRLKVIAQEALQKLDDRGTEAFRAALALNNVDQKKAALRKIMEDFKGLPVAAEAKKDLVTLK